MQTKSIKFIFEGGRKGQHHSLLDSVSEKLTLKKKKKKKMSTPKHFTKLRENFKEAIM